MTVSELPEDVQRQETAVGNLKELTLRAGYLLTICRRDEADVRDAVLLSREFQLCRQFAADTILREVVERPFDQGVAAGRAELERAAKERQALRDDRGRLQDAERGLASASASLERKSKALDSRANEIARAEEGLRAEAARLAQIEDIEAERQTIETERRRAREWAAEEQARVGREARDRIAALEAEWRSRNADLDARTSGLRGAEQALHLAGLAHARSKRRSLLIQLFLFSALVGGAFLPVRERILRPYVKARSEFETEKGEMASWQTRLAAHDDSLARADARVAERANSLDQRRTEVDAEAAEVRRQGQALLNRGAALAAWEAGLVRQAREAQGQQAALNQAAAELKASEERVRVQATDVARREDALATRERDVKRVEEFITPVKVRVVNDSRQPMDVAGTLGGAPFRLGSMGTVEVELLRGRHRYTLAARAAGVTPYGWRLVDWSGNGYVDVTGDGATFVVDGVYPRLWLQRR